VFSFTEWNKNYEEATVAKGLFYVIADAWAGVISCENWSKLHI
jgi:hypothetical protein